MKKPFRKLTISLTKKKPQTYNSYDDQASFSIFFFLPKNSAKTCTGVWLRETWFSSQQPMWCCVVYSCLKQHWYHTTPIADQCTTFIRVTDDLSDSQHRGLLCLSLPLQEASRRWVGVWERAQMDSWPTMRYSRPCNITLGNKTAGCFFQRTVSWWVPWYWSAESDVNISTHFFLFYLLNCLYLTHKFSQILSFQFSHPSYWGGMRKKLD